MWILYDSYKKSDSLTTLLIHNLQVPVLVLSKEADIIFSNRAAQQLLTELKVGTDSKSFYSAIDNVFRGRLKSIVDEVVNEKKSIRYDCWSNNSPARRKGLSVQRVALELNLSPQSWIDGNAVLVSCRDKSESLGRHQVVTQLLNIILPASKFLTQEFTRKLKFLDNVRPSEGSARLNTSLIAVKTSDRLAPPPIKQSSSAEAMCWPDSTTASQRGHESPNLHCHEVNAKCKQLPKCFHSSPGICFQHQASKSSGRNSLEHSFPGAEQVRKEDLVRLHRLLMEIRGVHLVSSFYANRLEVRSEIFNPVSELKNLIEFTSIKASRKQISVSLKTPEAIPQFVNGHRSTYSLFFDCLLNFAADHAMAFTVIEVKISVLIGSMSRVDIEHEVTFNSNSLSKEEFELHFVKDDQDTLSSTTLKMGIENYESYFAVLKVLLYLVPAHKYQISTGSDQTFTVKFSFSSDIVPDHVIERDVRISEASVNKNPGEIVWQATGVEGSQIKLAPITPSRDGSDQLQKQIGIIRRSSKAKSLGGLQNLAFMKAADSNAWEGEIQGKSHLLTPQLGPIKRHFEAEPNLISLQ